MCEKRKKNKKKKKKPKKLSQFLKSHISGMPKAISLKFGMWSTEVGGNVHSKICLVSSRQHRATEVRKLRFLSSCQYTHGVARRLLGPHDTLPCVLIYIRIYMYIFNSYTTAARDFTDISTQSPRAAGVYVSKIPSSRGISDIYIYHLGHTHLTGEELTRTHPVCFIQ